MRSRNTILFFVIVLLIPFAAFAVYNWYEKNWKKVPVYEKGQPISSFTFRDQNDQPYSSTKLKGKIVVVNFFFTQCPTICPKMIKNFSYLQEKLKGNDRLELLSITVDPEKDTPVELRKYCINRKIDTRNWNFLTHEKKEIYKLARNSFKLVASEGDGGPTDFIHSEKFILLDEKQRIRGYYDGTSQNETDQLITDIKKIENEN